MPIYIDTRGNPTLGIGICGRCSRKFALHELFDDNNYPGLKVCREDQDNIDPWRLPARATDDLTLPFCRPDVALDTGGPVPLYANQLFGVVDVIRPYQQWQPLTVYRTGDSVVPLPVNDPTTLPQYQMVCLVGGRSGASPPVWPTDAGVIVGNGDLTYLSSDPSGFPETLFALLADNGVTILVPDDMAGDGQVAWVSIGLAAQ